jgi:hypothetical protein
MVFFQTKNPNLGKFLRVLQWKMLVDFMAVRSILRPFGVFCGHMNYFMFIWYTFFSFWYFVPRKIWQPCLRSRVTSASVVKIYNAAISLERFENNNVFICFENALHTYVAYYNAVVVVVNSEVVGLAPDEKLQAVNCAEVEFLSEKFSNCT